LYLSVKDDEADVLREMNAFLGSLP
jgi:hypothetical protein